MKNNLQIDNFQQKYNASELENKVLDFWDESHVFEKSVESRDPKKRYVFYDGPPFATGLPHYGHILTSVIKDAIPRYWTMKGFRVDRVWGWDCHGIPIENMIEKELCLKGGKKGIEDMGIGKFNAACRAAILRFDKEWASVVRRIGRWVDFKNSYKTMDKSYMESVWWAFKTLNDKKLVYEGKRVILYCPRCATPLSNFEIAMDNSYKDLPGPSTIYKYKLRTQDPEQRTYLLAWSTTPWNKLATPALAVNPDLTYVKVKQKDEYYILAEKTLKILKKDPHYEIVAKYKGKDLEQFEFELHYDFYPDRKSSERAGVIIADNYVTADEGTGVVTLAVYGEDDYRIMTAHNVQLVYHVDDEGKLKDEVIPWQGMFMLKVNPLVNEDLASRGLIYHDEKRLHSIPVCYRCETRLYQAPVPAWFINIQKMKKDLLAQNENINWYPEYLKHGRFGKGLETAPDWNISRSRFWGTPMPVWRSSVNSQLTTHNSQQIRIIGSLEELKKWAVQPELVKGLSDIHREFIDGIEVWVDDEKTIKGKRIPEVFDCWVESGSMPYASIHYPFKNKELFESTHPAQFIVEYISQTRAWFYTLHVMSVGLFGKNTFENALTHGVIQAEDGTKMSKSKKNFPDPALLFEKYGVDALRFYLMSTVVMKGENLNFSENQVKELYQKIIQILWNIFSFYKLYARTDEVIKDTIGIKKMHVLDRWIVSRSQTLIKNTTQAMDHYDTVAYCRNIQEFVDDLSTWYLRRSRERFKADPGSMEVFGWVLKKLLLVMAPVTPFITEVIYQNLIGNTSLHLESWPLFDEKQIGLLLENQMNIARKIVVQAHAIRKESGIKVRQPLKTLTSVASITITTEIADLITEEVNVKKLQQRIGNDISVQLDTEISGELKAEGEARDLIHAIQLLRKAKGCKVTENIIVQVPQNFSKLPENLIRDIKQKTLIKSLVWGSTLSILNG